MRIEPATEADTGVLSDMLGEVEAYYGGQDTPGDPQQIREALFGPCPAATVLIARDDDGQALGFAAFSRLWPASGATTGIFLKELFVRGTCRRGGVGAQLMDAVRAAGLAAGCTRLEWTADTDNPTAVDFYAALGARQNKGKIVYRAPLKQ